VGSKKPNRNSLSHQESFASLGGPIFTALCLQFPPPPDSPELSPSALHEFAVLLGVMLLVAVILLLRRRK
jgi:hypothetical protein